MFNFFIHKQKNTVNLSEEDKLELQQIERESYMNEARKLVAERGVKKAKNGLNISDKKEVKKIWPM